ncbi:VOC family protein [Rhizobium sp. TH2]|uniref:VOC family protein n=1 Tax=Rhizobium sp. TH2 TaxID=2775403 RepID=UPI0021573D7F|nr:VOC family protein [Rhizobium sp. TH2]UVC10641.1 VOC family protein [Rhizobium sp. TH2]
MGVLRIVANLLAPDPGAVAAFYRDLLDLDVVMDHGWIVTLAAGGNMVPQLSIGSEGGAGAPMPDISIEVDDVDTVFARAVHRGHEITYPLTDEDWGVRRFFVRDPSGNVANILMHL